MFTVKIRYKVIGVPGKYVYETIKLNCHRVEHIFTAVTDNYGIFSEVIEIQ